MHGVGGGSISASAMLGTEGDRANRGKELRRIKGAEATTPPEAMGVGQRGATA